MPPDRAFGQAVVSGARAAALCACHFSIFARRISRFFLETLPKMADLMKPDETCNFPNALVGMLQQRCGFGQAEFQQILIGRRLQAEPKASQAFGFADVGAGGKLLQRNTLAVVTGDILQKQPHALCDRVLGNHFDRGEIANQNQPNTGEQNQHLIRVSRGRPLLQRRERRQQLENRLTPRRFWEKTKVGSSSFSERLLLYCSAGLPG